MGVPPRYENRWTGVETPSAMMESAPEPPTAASEWWAQQAPLEQIDLQPIMRARPTTSDPRLQQRERANAALPSQEKAHRNQLSGPGRASEGAGSSGLENCHHREGMVLGEATDQPPEECACLRAKRRGQVHVVVRLPAVARHAEVRAAALNPQDGRGVAVDHPLSGTVTGISHQKPLGPSGPGVAPRVK